jgi:hypothetical protein
LALAQTILKIKVKIYASIKVEEPHLNPSPKERELKVDSINNSNSLFKNKVKILMFKFALLLPILTIIEHNDTGRYT